MHQSQAYQKHINRIRKKSNTSQNMPSTSKEQTPGPSGVNQGDKNTAIRAVSASPVKNIIKHNLMQQNKSRCMNNIQRVTLNSHRSMTQSSPSKSSKIISQRGSQKKKKTPSRSPISQNKNSSPGGQTIKNEHVKIIHHQNLPCRYQGHYHHYDVLPHPHHQPPIHPNLEMQNFEKTNKFAPSQLLQLDDAIDDDDDQPPQPLQLNKSLKTFYSTIEITSPFKDQQIEMGSKGGVGCNKELEKSGEMSLKHHDRKISKVSGYDNYVSGTFGPVISQPHVQLIREYEISASEKYLNNVKGSLNNTGKQAGYIMSENGFNPKNLDTDFNKFYNHEDVQSKEYRNSMENYNNQREGVKSNKDKLKKNLSRNSFTMTQMNNFLNQNEFENMDQTNKTQQFCHTKNSSFMKQMTVNSIKEMSNGQSDNHKQSLLEGTGQRAIHKDDCNQSKKMQAQQDTPNNDEETDLEEFLELEQTSQMQCQQLQDELNKQQEMIRNYNKSIGKLDERSSRMSQSQISESKLSNSRHGSMVSGYHASRSYKYSKASHEDHNMKPEQSQLFVKSGKVPVDQQQNSNYRQLLTESNNANCLDESDIDYPQLQTQPDNPKKSNKIGNDGKRKCVQVLNTSTYPTTIVQNPEVTEETNNSFMSQSQSRQSHHSGILNKQYSPTQSKMSKSSISHVSNKMSGDQRKRSNVVGNKKNTVKTDTIIQSGHSANTAKTSAVMVNILSSGNFYNSKKSIQSSQNLLPVMCSGFDRNIYKQSSISFDKSKQLVGKLRKFDPLKDSKLGQRNLRRQKSYEMQQKMHQRVKTSKVLNQDETKISNVDEPMIIQRSTNILNEKNITLEKSLSARRCKNNAYHQKSSPNTSFRDLSKNQPNSFMRSDLKRNDRSRTPLGRQTQSNEWKRNSVANLNNAGNKSAKNGQRSTITTNMNSHRSISRDAQVRQKNQARSQIRPNAQNEQTVIYDMKPSSSFMQINQKSQQNDYKKSVEKAQREMFQRVQDQIQKKQNEIKSKIHKLNISSGLGVTSTNKIQSNILHKEQITRTARTLFQNCQMQSSVLLKNNKTNKYHKKFLTHADRNATNKGSSSFKSTGISQKVKMLKRQQIDVSRDQFDKDSSYYQDIKPKPKSVINKQSKINNSCNNLNLQMSSEGQQDNQQISYFKSSTCSPSNMSNMSHVSGSNQQSSHAASNPVSPVKRNKEIEIPDDDESQMNQQYQSNNSFSVVSPKELAQLQASQIGLSQNLLINSKTSRSMLHSFHNKPSKVENRLVTNNAVLGEMHLPSSCKNANQPTTPVSQLFNNFMVDQTSHKDEMLKKQKLEEEKNLIRLKAQQLVNQYTKLNEQVNGGDSDLMQEVKDLEMLLNRKEKRERSVVKTYQERKEEIQRKDYISNQEREKFEKFQKGLSYINKNFGAVIKGYQARRIYFNNSEIRKYRIDYRDQIQFAFMLKSDINKMQKEMLQNRKQYNNTELIMTRDSLKKTMNDMNQIRSNFQVQFQCLLESKYWVKKCKPRKIQDILYEQASQFEQTRDNYLIKKSMSHSMSNYNDSICSKDMPPSSQPLTGTFYKSKDEMISESDQLQSFNNGRKGLIYQPESSNHSTNPMSNLQISDLSDVNISGQSEKDKRDNYLSGMSSNMANVIHELKKTTMRQQSITPAAETTVKVQSAQQTEEVERRVKHQPEYKRVSHLAIYENLHNGIDRCKSQMTTSPFRDMQKNIHFEVTFSPTEMDQQNNDTTSNKSREFVSKIPKFANKPRQVTPGSSVHERDISNSKIPKFSLIGSMNSPNQLKKDASIGDKFKKQKEKQEQNRNRGSPIYGGPNPSSTKKVDHKVCINKHWTKSQQIACQKYHLAEQRKTSIDSNLTKSCNLKSKKSSIQTQVHDEMTQPPPNTNASVSHRPESQLNQIDSSCLTNSFIQNADSFRFNLSNVLNVQSNSQQKDMMIQNIKPVKQNAQDLQSIQSSQQTAKKRISKDINMKNENQKAKVNGTGNPTTERRNELTYRSDQFKNVTAIKKSPMTKKKSKSPIKKSPKKKSPMKKSPYKAQRQSSSSAKKSPCKKSHKRNPGQISPQFKQSVEKQNITREILIDEKDSFSPITMFQQTTQIKNLASNVAVNNGLNSTSKTINFGGRRSRGDRSKGANLSRQHSNNADQAPNLASEGMGQNRLQKYLNNLPNNLVSPDPQGNQGEINVSKFTLPNDNIGLTNTTPQCDLRNLSKVKSNTDASPGMVSIPPRCKQISATNDDPYTTLGKLQEMMLHLQTNQNKQIQDKKGQTANADSQTQILQLMNNLQGQIEQLMMNNNRENNN